MPVSSDSLGRLETSEECSGVIYFMGKRHRLSHAGDKLTDMGTALPDFTGNELPPRAPEGFRGSRDLSFRSGALDSQV